MIRLFKQWRAKRRLAADRAVRQQLVGKPYAKRRAAALKGLGRPVPECFREVAA